MKKYIFGIVLSVGSLILPALALAAPTVQITSPNGGETYKIGDTVHITWTSTNVDKVTLMYQASSGTANTIVSNLANVGSYDWTVNVGNTTNTQFKIEVIAYQTGVGSVIDYSDNYFTAGLSPGQSTTPVSDLSLSAWYSSSQITAGQTLTLYWGATSSSSQDYSCSVKDERGQVVGASSYQGQNGSVQFVPDATHTYTITCVGGGYASVSKNLTVTVLPITNQASAPTLNLTASPSDTNASQLSLISWSSSNSTGCSYLANGKGPNDVGTSGSFDGRYVTNQGEDMKFDFTCTGPGGSVTKSITITVSPPSTNSVSAPTVTAANTKTGLTTQQAISLIAVVQSAPGVPASAFVNLITSFSNITVNQAASLIAVVQASPGTPANAFVNLLISFTSGT